MKENYTDFIYINAADSQSSLGQNFQQLQNIVSYLYNLAQIFTNLRKFQHSAKILGVEAWSDHAESKTAKNSKSENSSPGFIGTDH